MIEKMTRYSFVLLAGGQEKFLEDLQELGVVDITRSERPVDERSEKMLLEAEGLRKRISEIKAGSDAHMQELKNGLDALRREIEELEPWGEYDRKRLEGLGLGVHFYNVARKLFDPSWAESYPLEIINEKAGRVWFVVLGDNSGFPAKEIPAPSRSVAEVETDLASKEEEIKAYSRELESLKTDIPEMERRLAEANSDLSRYLASQKGESAVQGHIVVFEGFAPEDGHERLSEALDGMDCWWSSEAAKVEDQPPIEFRNNRFVRMFEPLTDMYGRPAYDGFDPTPFISIFFLLFFAMCMGDMGYGLLLIVVGFLLKKVKSFSNLAPLVVTLGIGTVVVGFFFHTFFSMDISQWECIPKSLKSVMVPATVAGYDGTMVLSLAIGIVHLCLAMIVKTVMATKNQGFIESLGTWGWTLLIVGGVVLAMVAVMGIIDAKVTKIAVIALGVICAIGIFPLNNIHRHPLKNVGSGLWDTYNMATGILGDVLSYLRLYALGLAGAMLGFAFNDLAKMALGDGGARWIAFILIVVIGHTLNLAMAALGAFVHPLRLNFLEFFKNSGYEGAGRKYNPLSK